MRKRLLSRLVGQIEDVEIRNGAKGVRKNARSVSVRVRLTTGSGVTFDCFSIGRRLRTRVQELVVGTDQLIGNDFELLVNEDGQIEGLRLLPIEP